MTIPRPLVLACLACLVSSAAAAGPPAGRAPAQSEAPAPPPGTPAASEPPAESRLSSAIGLFAGVEEAWAASDAERLASLLDTTAVRITIKPGAPPTTALTRVAAAFLLQDQLRLVHTREFQVTRMECEKKRRVCRAFARWTGDWGGRQGTRAVRVMLVAQGNANRWLLTEIRAED